mmetsp:Transcript_45277/g.88950  ORF Transcript_45277/g.88950 Transcript_45277/m.88950 type:complete len:247 (-) Transcript_45277:2440-3180(-)
MSRMVSLSGSVSLNSFSSPFCVKVKAAPSIAIADSSTLPSSDILISATADCCSSSLRSRAEASLDCSASNSMTFWVIASRASRSRWISAGSSPAAVFCCTSFWICSLCSTTCALRRVCSAASSAILSCFAFSALSFMRFFSTSALPPACFPAKLAKELSSKTMPNCSEMASKSTVSELASFWSRAWSSLAKLASNSFFSASLALLSTSSACFCSFSRRRFSTTIPLIKCLAVSAESTSRAMFCSLK